MQLECINMQHEALLVPVLLYGSELMIYEEKERSRIRNLQIESLRSLFGIRRIYRMLNVWIRKMCRVRKGKYERSVENVHRCFGHIERMRNDGITKRICGRVCR